MKIFDKFFKMAYYLANKSASEYSYQERRRDWPYEPRQPDGL